MSMCASNTQNAAIRSHRNSLKLASLNSYRFAIGVAAILTFRPTQNTANYVLASTLAYGILLVEFCRNTRFYCATIWKIIPVSRTIILYTHNNELNFSLDPLSHYICNYYRSKNYEENLCKTYNKNGLIS